MSLIDECAEKVKEKLKESSSKLPNLIQAVAVGALTDEKGDISIIIVNADTPKPVVVPLAGIPDLIDGLLECYKQGTIREVKNVSKEVLRAIKDTFFDGVEKKEEQPKPH